MENAMISDRQSEQSVINHIRELRRTKEDDALMNEIAKNYLNSSLDDVTARRRAHDLLRIAAEAA